MGDTSHKTAMRQNVVSLHSEGSSGSNLRTQEHLSVKHALPKTRITHTILHENVSQDRQLAMVMKTLNHRQKKYEGLAYQTRKTFLHRQKRKEEKWKREDTVRLNSLKFLTIRNESENRPASMMIMYRKPRYPITESDDIEEAKPPDLNAFLLPIMEITPERTEIVTHREKTFMMKLPPVVKVDELKLKRFNTYCGASFLESGLSKTSERFQSLTRSLSNIPAHFGQMPFENIHKFGDDDDDDITDGFKSEDEAKTDVEEKPDEDREHNGRAGTAGTPVGHVETRDPDVTSRDPDVTSRDPDVTSRDHDLTSHDPDMTSYEVEDVLYEPPRLKTPEPSLYRRLKIDRESMFPMLNKLSRVASENSLFSLPKGSEVESKRRRSEHIVRDIKTKSIKDLTKRYGMLATVTAQFRRPSK